MILKINNRIELQNTATDHSADIDYKDVMEIYRACTKEPYSLLIIDTTLAASNPLKFRKNLFDSLMTLTDELKIFDNKIKANQAQYNLGREAAKMSALYSKDLVEKYEYLAGEDLGHRPIVLEETKFEYSPLGMILGKSFKKDNVKNAKREREREREWF